MRAVSQLRSCGSVAADIMLRLGLTRGLIKSAFKQLANSRPLQSTLSSLVCATRFKFYEQGRLLPTRCRAANCGMVGGFDHLQECTGVGIMKDEDKQNEEKVCQYSEELVYHAYAVNPGYPVPIRTDEEGELELYDSGEDAGSESGVSQGSLSFEMDP